MKNAAFFILDYYMNEWVPFYVFKWNKLSRQSTHRLKTCMHHSSIIALPSKIESAKSPIIQESIRTYWSSSFSISAPTTKVMHA